MTDRERTSRWLLAADEYFDSAPRPDADVVDAGAFSLFVSRTPWTYYARPAITHPRPVVRADLEMLAEICLGRGVGLEIEWVHELHPELADLAARFGLAVTHHALMTMTPVDPVRSVETDCTVRIVDADDPALLDAQAVAAVSFGAGGTAVGPQGAADRAVASDRVAPMLPAHLRDRAQRLLTVTAVAETSAGVVAAGSYQPIGGTAEVLAVSTLPAVRRQGLAAAITVALVQHARTNNVTVLLLSAQNDDVARVYWRVGFHRIGTVCAAEPRT